MFNRKWLSVIAFALMIITLQASVHSQIFVPRPKGDNDSLDSDPLSEAQDRVFLVSGDRVSGMVADILPEGVVRIVNPIFKEPLLVRLNGIRNIQLSGKDKVLDGPDSVALTNGNRVRGAVRQITADAVIVLTKSMGTVSIKRTMVRSIDFHVAREVLLDTDFSSGSTGAWKHKTGSWRVQNNKYYSLSPNGWTYAEVSQRGPTTLAWTLSGQLSGYVTFAFFANSSASYWGGSSIAVRFSRSYVYIYQVTGNSTRTIASKPLGRSLNRATLIASYDPESGRLRLKVNDRDLGQFTIKPPIKQGRFVHFYCQTPVTIDSVRIHRGAAVLGKEDKTHETNDQFLLGNRDKVSGQLETLGDGVAVIKTSYGKLDVKKDNLLRIVFRSKGQQTPRRRKGDVALGFHDGSALTAQMKTMNAKHIGVSTEFMGDVKIMRKAARMLRFDIYDDMGPSSTGPQPVPADHSVALARARR